MGRDMQMDCKHEELRASVAVNRLEDSGGFMADVKVACTQCGILFHFPGYEFGFSFHGPRVSIDGTELRTPIAPGPLPIPTSGHFAVRM